MFDPPTIAAIVTTFLLAGTVKGVIGLGLPTVSLGLLTAVLDLPTAMALLLVPSLATNVWQALAGGQQRAVLARIWPFLAAAAVTVGLGATALTAVDSALLSALLGLLLVTYAVVNMTGVRVALSARQARWAGPPIGAVNGILTGMTGSFVVPGVMFLQAIGLPRDMLVQAMDMLFAVSTAALALALQDNDLLNASLGAWSAAALGPAAIGMLLGQRLRRRLSERRFRQIFFVALLILGMGITAKSLQDAGRMDAAEYSNTGACQARSTPFYGADSWATVAPPQPDPAPAVQPKQWRSTTIDRESSASRSKSAMCRGTPGSTGMSSIWLKSQS